MIVIFVLCSLTGLVSVGTTIFLFCRRSSEERPLFVTAQMIMLNLAWPCWLIYYTAVTHRMISEDTIIVKQTIWDNLFCSLGNFFFLIHDWLFIEQYINVSLVMPIAVRTINSNEDIVSEKAQARTLIVTASAVFYSLLIGWFILSATTGTFSFRTTYNVVVVYMALVFVVSL